MRWPYTIGTLYFIWHLSTSILHNILLLGTGAKPDESPMLYHDVLMQYRNLPPVRYFAQLAGLHGSYCFYGPEVGSSYHSLFVLEDSASDQKTLLSDPGLRSHASRIRYRSLLEVAGGWLLKVAPHEDSQVRPLAKALGVSICQHMAARHPGLHITCSYLAMGIPPVGSGDANVKPTHVLLFKTKTIYYEAHEESHDDASSRPTIPTHWHRPVTRRGNDADMA
ncbi:hypothetical protein [Sphingobacterium pedocola]|uniref:Uncharacterized protein n=1 Tax=Sphingobacterium pedocola TaxID=2082722 RepID=A0ABR9T7L1_9SPHI|nr:hypothetical protein [Sphingobacterium pedocola]MBE8720864.1 hypothetical protein [Sphingobacterium pedocola]